MKRANLQGARWKKVVMAAIVALVLIISAWQVPTVKAAMRPGLASVAGWVAAVTRIPIRLYSVYEPNGKQPVAATGQTGTPPMSHYYLEATRTPDSYSINVYYVQVPVSFNNEQELLEKDGPLSESQHIASISGNKKTSDMQPLALTIPPEAKPFALVPGVTAYQKNAGTQVDWQNGGWGFEFVGSNAPTALEQVKRVAAIDPSAFQQLAAAGTVKIAEGNRFQVSVTWEEAEVRYVLQTADIQHLPDLLHSMQEWQQTNG